MIFLKIKIFKKQYSMCGMYALTIPIYATFQVNRFENGFDIVQKLRSSKIAIGKIFNFRFLPKYSTQKDENSTIELPSNYSSKSSYAVTSLI